MSRDFCLCFFIELLLVRSTSLERISNFVKYSWIYSYSSSTPRCIHYRGVEGSRCIHLRGVMTPRCFHHRGVLVPGHEYNVESTETGLQKHLLVPNTSISQESTMESWLPAVLGTINFFCKPALMLVLNRSESRDSPVLPGVFIARELFRTLGSHFFRF